MIEKALIFATHHHQGQTRKYTGEPYIFHPIAVYEILRKVTQNEITLVAALLHDTIEDCEGVTEAVIEKNFNAYVRRVVQYCTHIPKPRTNGLNRAKRKDLDRVHYMHGPTESQNIKMADMIHNCPSIIEHDPKFANTYMKEKRLLANSLRKADSRLHQMFDHIEHEFKRKRGDLDHK